MAIIAKLAEHVMWAARLHAVKEEEPFDLWQQHPSMWPFEGKTRVR